MANGLDERVQRLHEEADLSDVHIHPSLKAYLFRRNLRRHYWSGKSFDPFSSRSDFRTLRKGGVGVIWAAHYLPERGLFKDCALLTVAAMLLVPVYNKLMKGPPFKRLLEMMDALEREVRRDSKRVEVAKSVADIRRIRGEKKIAVVHAVEGSHSLDGNVDNLDVLAERGVAMITLNHFYANGVAAHTDGIPKDMFIRKVCKLKLGIGTLPPLTDYGKAVLGRMKDLQMVVDVSHCAPEARAAIYAELGGAHPVVASHVGVQKYNPDTYNLGDDEIREIAKTGGAVGVIFMTYWLDETHPDKGLPAIWNTIEHIHKVTGSWDHIVLGTDFDGFTDPPDDLRDASSMPKVTKMLLEHGVEEDDVQKILGGNAMRVLESGWR